MAAIAITDYNSVESIFEITKLSKDIFDKI